MNIDSSLLSSSEKVIFALRELYLSNGFKPFKMSKFEEYDLYARHKDFLVNDNVITFTDIGGKLLALKPDVTLSIINRTKDEPDKTRKIFYDENVYRMQKSTGSYKEIMQTGAEIIGKIKSEDIKSMILLSLEGLNRLSENCVLALSNLDIISECIEAIDLNEEANKEIYKAVGEKNTGEIVNICSQYGKADLASPLISLIKANGKISHVLPRIKKILKGSKKSKTFLAFLDSVKDRENIILDFSITGDINYYNGIIFKGYIEGIPTEVLSGGQYDNLMAKMGRKSCAVGFAFYTDEFERNEITKEKSDENEGYINIALPKGRLGDKIYKLFALAGYECPSILEPNRKLIFENEEKKIRYFWVKPSDVAIYVERGAADIGVAGKDILAEYEPDVYELLDLKKGKCRMAVAAKKGADLSKKKTLRVATKFSSAAKKYYLSRGRDIDIIHLNGSIEIAPILGLADCIMDIVETGTTLRENNLEVIEEVFQISARLISNKTSYKFKTSRIEKLVAGLEAITLEGKND